jgi:hypothetical protein
MLGANNSQTFQASVRSLAIKAGIDPGCKYKDQSITKLAKLMQAVSA